MSNKQSIQDIDAALDRWHRKLNLAVTKINELRDKRKKLIKGYIKHPEPKGVRVMIPVGRVRSILPTLTMPSRASARRRQSVARSYATGLPRSAAAFSFPAMVLI